MRRKNKKKKIETVPEEEISFKQFFDEIVEKKLIPGYTSKRELELYFTSCGFGPKETRTVFMTGVDRY